MEGAQVARDEGPGREALLDCAPTLSRVESIGRSDRRREFAVVVHDDARAAVFKHFGDGAAPGGDNGCAAGATRS